VTSRPAPIPHPNWLRAAARGPVRSCTPPGGKAFRRGRWLAERELFL